jgi:hypothetical protein
MRPETRTHPVLLRRARRAIWVKTKEGRVGESLSALASELGKADPIVIESTSIVEFWGPDLFLVVLDGPQLGLKRSGA